MNAGITRHAFGEFTFDRVDGAIENVYTRFIVDLTNTIPASLKAPLQDQHISRTAALSM